MTRKLVECIPNFSEGRRIEVVDSIAGAIAAIPGVSILDRHSDADHNRSVITFAGPPEAVSQAAFASIRRAAEWIDLEQQRGAHPRIGATDVVPFVPLRGTTMEECVQLARELGRRVGEELRIPVYLYEEASLRSDRVRLEDIRRGEYESLKQTIASDAYRAPDFGPKLLGNAGATVIGARAPLIAFNVYLTTDDLKTARQIARSVRHSSGGLRYVKALGLLVEGRAQISMNLTDTTRTPVHAAVEMVRREATRYGVAVHHSELVGLMPTAALADSAQWYLQLDGFKLDQLLETRLSGEEREASFLQRLAAGTPTPGGGSAAAYAGALSASLVAMVARLTLGKPKLTAVSERMRQIVEEAEGMRMWFEQATERDAEAFNQVLEAMRMQKGKPAEQVSRQQAIERALHGAAAIPLEGSRRAARVLHLAVEAAESGLTSAASDSGVAALLARAALQSCALNVRINAAAVSDAAAGEAWKAEVDRLSASSDSDLKRVEHSLRGRAGLDF